MQSSQPEVALGPVTLAGLREAQDLEDTGRVLPVYPHRNQNVVYHRQNKCSYSREVGGETALV